MSSVDYGLFNAVNSMSVVITSFALVLNFQTAKGLVKLGQDESVRSLIVYRLLRDMVLGALLLGGFILVIAPLLAAFLRLSSLTPIYIYAGIVFSYTLQTYLSGVIQGLGKYNLMVSGQIFQTGMRLALICVAVPLMGYSYNGALMAVLISILLSLGYHLYFICKYIPPGLRRNATAPPRMRFEMFKGALHMALLWAYLGIITNIDIPLVKHYFTEEATGLFSAAAIMGRIAYFLPSMLLFVLFPEVVKSSKEGKSSFGQVAAITALTLLVALGFAGLVAMFPEEIITLLYGERYAAADAYFVVTSLSMALVAVSSVLFNFFLAKELHGYMIPTAAIMAAMLCAIHFFYHDSPMQVAIVFLIGVGATLLANVVFLVYKFRMEFMQLLRPAQKA